jgi:spore coat protein CotF
MADAPGMYAVTQQLEALNNTVSEQLLKQDEVISAIRNMGKDGTATAEDQNKRLRDSFKDTLGPITRFLALGLKQMQDSAIVLERLQLKSVLMGTNTIDLLDNIGKESTLARTADKDNWQKA